MVITFLFLDKTQFVCKQRDWLRRQQTSHLAGLATLLPREELTSQSEQAIADNKKSIINYFKGAFCCCLSASLMEAKTTIIKKYIKKTTILSL